PAAVLNKTFVSNLYTTLLHRAADPEGLAYYTQRLNNGALRARIVAEFVGGQEYHIDIVQQLYQTYLHRAADRSGLNTYVAFIDGGGTVTQLRAILLSSDEYYMGRAGGNNSAYLAALYQDVLGRPIDPNGLETYSKMLASGSRTQVAWSLLT